MTPLRSLARIVARLWEFLCGDVPNVEWLRAELSRAVVLDRAKAQLAIAELERCLAARRRGIRTTCFSTLPR